MLVLRPYQEKAIQDIAQRLAQGYRKLVFQMSTGSGKCFSKDTKIRMYDGSIMKVQDIKEGYLVMGDDFTPREAYGITSGTEPMYRILSAKKSFMEWECNESHILALVDNFGVKLNISIKKYRELSFEERFYLKLYKANGETSQFCVEPIGTGEYYGFAVDGNNLFQLSDGTIVHNTKTFSAICHRYISRPENKRSILILVHRKELLTQTRIALYESYRIDCGIIQAGMKYIKPARVYVAMVESMNTRINKLPTEIGMLIVDEAHLGSFNKMHKHFEAHNGTTTEEVAGTGEPYIIGFTATPISAKKKDPMKNYYQDIVCGIDISELIDLNFLCQNVTFAPRETVDRAALDIKNGEFDEHQMSQEYSKAKHVQNTVDAYKKYADGTKAIVFNVSIEHSKKVNDAFRMAGYNSRHLDSNMNKMERDNAIAWFKATPGAILNNVAIATTGTDIPSIETVIFNKATLSLSLWIQAVGRGARPYDNKKIFTILDMGGNALAHGDFSEHRDWYDIFHNPKKPREKEGVAPIKTCPECEAIISASATVCKFCGYVYPAKEVAQEQALGDFIVVTKGIDVQDLIQKNNDKKQYYTFYRIGKDLAEGAKNTIPEMTDESATFILRKYKELAIEWCEKSNILYSKWHEKKMKENLYQELMSRFPTWTPAGWMRQEQEIPVYIPPQQQAEENPFYMAPIKNLSSI